MKERKEYIYVIKRTLVEEFQVLASNRKEALEKGTEEANVYKTTVVKETAVKQK